MFPYFSFENLSSWMQNRLYRDLWAHSVLHILLKSVKLSLILNSGIVNNSDWFSVCTHTTKSPLSLPCLRHAQGWQNISRQAIWIDDWYLAKNLHCGSSFSQYASRKVEPVANPSLTSFPTRGCSWLSLLHYESISQQVWGRGRKSGGKSKHCSMPFSGKMMESPRESGITVVYYCVHLIHGWWQCNNPDRNEVRNWAAYSNHSENCASNPKQSHYKSNVTEKRKRRGEARTPSQNIHSSHVLLLAKFK